MRVLLLGANGQLGRALQEALGEHDCVALDHSRLDIVRLAAVREAVRAYRPDVVLNAAAYNQVDAAEQDAAAAYRVNALGPRNVAVVTAAHRIPVLHVSTDYVFDGTAKRPYHEFDRPNPRSVYGASKLAGEEAVRALNPRHYIVRTAWLYHLWGQNFPKTICELARQSPEVRVVSDQYGSPTYAPHLAAAVAQLLATGAYGTYHLAGRGGTSWFDLTRALYRALGVRTPVRPVATAEFPRPAERPRYSVLTTVQDPEILLPPWEEGVAAFASQMRGHTTPA
ncbi:MAG: dTDP-4-dehydrorhamnose reductase [Thermodesulfobacteriota bacterium]|jgi:dTDP-4-dehydrorhamnose reductase